MTTTQQNKNSILFRKSENPESKSALAVFFYTNKQLVGKYVTANGSILDAGHLLNNWLNHNSWPPETVGVTLCVEKEP